MNGSLTSLAGPFAAWLFDYCMLATVLLLVAWVTWRWVRQPARRIIIAWAVVVELIALAVICALPWRPTISLAPTISELVAFDMPTTEIPHSATHPVEPVTLATESDSIAPSSATVAVSSAASQARSHWSWLELLALAYIAGVVLIGLWLGWGVVAATWLQHRALVAPDDLQTELADVVGEETPPSLLVSSHVTDAVALNVLKPTIVLPEALVRRGPSATLRAVLSHEWAHIRHRDLWLLALGRCLMTVLFAHPLFWWFRRAIRNNQELLADAVAAGSDRQAYAEELVRLTRGTTYPSLVARSAAVGIWESSSQLSRRIAMLLDDKFRVEPAGSNTWRRRAMLPLVLLGMACSLVTFRPVHSADEPVRQAKPNSSATKETNHQEQKRVGPEVVGSTYGGVYAASGPSNKAKQTVYIPGYQPLMYEEVVEALGLTADQWKQLLAIKEKYQADIHAFVLPYKEANRRPSQEEWNAARPQWEKNVQKGVEDVLGPEQMRAIELIVFRERAFAYLRSPQLAEQLGATAEQKEQLRALGEESDRKLIQRRRERLDEALERLTPQQKDRLRQEVLGQQVPGAFRQVKTDSGLVQVPSTYPYPDLSEAQPQEEIGLDENQKSQVRDILGESVNLTDWLAREALNLPPEERNTQPRGEFGAMAGSADWVEEQMKKRQAKILTHPVVKATVEMRKRFESVLTPEQLEAYQDKAFRRIATSALKDMRGRNKIGLTEEQSADLIRLLLDESVVNHRRLVQHVGGQMLDVLTPAQQEQLRGILHQHGMLGSIRRPEDRK